VLLVRQLAPFDGIAAGEDRFAMPDPVAQTQRRIERAEETKAAIARSRPTRVRRTSPHSTGFTPNICEKTATLNVRRGQRRRRNMLSQRPCASETAS
jgi:hypothetical protein